MFETDTISKVISILCYFGLFISSISGLVSLSHNYNPAVMMTSLVVMLSMLVVVATFEIWDFFNISQKDLYYSRSIILLHYSLLVVGLTDIGVGFGILGFLIALLNLVSGVFDGDRCNESTYKSNLEEAEPSS